MAQHEPLVAMTGIAKRFGGVVACAGVDFTVAPGEVHALLGENGAGKSTLMNVLSGVITDYDGQVTVAGVPRRFHSPAEAQAAGIATIHQELDLVPDLSVAENMFLGREPRTRWRTVDRRTSRRESARHLAVLGVGVDPRRSIRSLRVGEQQLVEIAKALSLDARVLVMDEPTAALADAEVRGLFDVITRLREQGVGIVYISHRMDEIEVIADRATVMRNGAVAGTVDPRVEPRHRLISLMVGRSVDALFGTRDDGSASRGGSPKAAGEVVLRTGGLAYRSKHALTGRTDPDGIDLTVHAGEIVGLAGLMGAGRTELLETLYGAAPLGRVTGEIQFGGQRYLPTNPRAALARGVAFVPEDRRGAGLVLEHSVGHNITLTALRSLCTAGVVRRRRERGAVARQIGDLAIKARTAAVAVGTLSGGNQQKVVFARQLLRTPRLLMLDEPTRGVDIGAKAEIYRLLHRLAAEGMAILVASSELPELLGVCDRIVVLRRGRVMAELAGETASQQQILAAAMGSADGTSPAAATAENSTEEA